MSDHGIGLTRGDLNSDRNAQKRLTRGLASPEPPAIFSAALQTSNTPGSKGRYHLGGSLVTGDSLRHLIDKGEWDYFKLVTTIPAEQAFRPLSEGGCSLVKG